MTYNRAILALPTHTIHINTGFFLQFLTSPFLSARFHLFSHQLKFFEAPLGTPGALAPATPPPSVGLACGLLAEQIRAHLTECELMPSVQSAYRQHKLDCVAIY